MSLYHSFLVKGSTAFFLPPFFDLVSRLFFPCDHFFFSVERWGQRGENAEWGQGNGSHIRIYFSSDIPGSSERSRGDGERFFQEPRDPPPDSPFVRDAAPGGYRRDAHRQRHALVMRTDERAPIGVVATAKLSRSSEGHSTASECTSEVKIEVKSGENSLHRGVGGGGWGDGSRG